MEWGGVKIGRHCNKSASAIRKDATAITKTTALMAPDLR